MTDGHFVWTDLSTYNMQAAKADYVTLFGWIFSDSGGYDFAQLDSQTVAAVFPMPQRLADINMPSFWMSYVQVDDIDQTVETARTFEGVIVEVEPQAFGTDARISLVRDPSGAGFTVYQGPAIAPRIPAQSAGHVVARYHHLPDVKLIEPFYRRLFGWSFVLSSSEPWNCFDVRRSDGTLVAHAEEVPESIRGNYRYWIPAFAVRSIPAVTAILKNSGGDILSELGDNRLLVADRQGAHFIIESR